jgi:hydroxymethylpyrimidine pyrophosphatase-like HAD family hydrolase
MTPQTDRLLSGNGWQPMDWAGTKVARPGGLTALEIADLLPDFDRLIALLADQVDSAEWLDAYLLSAGALQILEDHSVPGSLRRGEAAVHLGGRQSLSGRLGRAALGVAQRVEQTRHEVSTSAEWCADMRRDLTYLADVLARAVLDGEEVDEATATALTATAHAIRTSSKAPSTVSQMVARLPSAFRSFDQHPHDVAELVRRFAVSSPQRDVPVLAVGVRTSGAYLAPLAAAALRREAFADVGWLTMRPGIPPGRSDRRMLGRIAACGGEALVLDDPPATGTSIAATVAALCRSGIAADRITLLLSVLNSDGRLPVLLDGARRVTLPWPDWAVHQHLLEASVASALSTMLPAEVQVLGVQRQPPLGSPARGHVLARYHVRLKDAAAREFYDRDLAVEGAGIGYFGRHALAVARALSGWVPEVLGFEDGLLYRAWLPTRGRPAAPPPAAVVAEYVVARHRSLPAAQDQSRCLQGRQPVWEVAARILSRGFGRAGVIVRGALVEPLVRELLHVERPSIVDGRMEPTCWALGAAKPTKVAFAEGAFSNYDLGCYDPVFDLAGAATVSGSAQYRRVLLDSFESLAGVIVDEERWLLYQLVHLWNAKRMDPRQRWRVCVEQAAAMQRYLASVFLSDLKRVDSGPWCAIDVDGVLESETFGFPASTTAGMLALRALQAHGFRTFLATGRSLPEVRQRCAAYGLVGGVAEYGTVLYDHRAGEAIRLTSDEVQDQIDQLRRSLGALPALEVDPGYQHIVRLRQRDANGRTQAVPEAVVAAQLPPGAAGWRVIVGDGQTDLVPPGVDKGRAALALVERNDPGQADRQRPLRLAVGDTATDVPLFALASLPLAVGNASPAARTGGTPVLRDAYQAGLAAAAGRLIGHPVGGCGRCRPPDAPAVRLRLLQLLSVQEAGPTGMTQRAVAIAAGRVRRGGGRGGHAHGI